MFQFLREFLHPSLGIMIEEGFILLLVIVLNIVVRYVVHRIYQQSKKLKENFLKSNFVQRIIKPIHLMIWLLGLSYMVYIAIVQLPMVSDLSAAFAQFRRLVIIGGFTWLFVEAKKQFQYSWMKRLLYSGKTPDHAKINLLSKLASFTIFVVAMLIILDTLGIHIGALIALGGVGGLALGFAAKDVFANFFSGFMLHITRPFQIGDWIHTLNKETEGTVEHIGFYLTCLRSFDKRPFYVPNSLFSSQIIVNASRMTNRRIYQTVGVRYEDFDVVEKIVNEIREMLKNNSKIDSSQHLLVDFVEYAPSSLNILIYTFTKSIVWKEWLEAQQQVLLEVGRIIQKNGAEIAFPTTTVHLNQKKPS